MELDELKSAWTQYDKKLTENLKLNEELIRKMNLNNSKKELQKPLISELVGIIILPLFILYVGVSSIRYIDEPKYCIPGFISLAIGLVYMTFGIYRANRFLNIDYYSSSALKMQMDIAKLKKLVLHLRKYELLLIPIFVISILPILYKAIHNIDIYQHIKFYAIVVIACSSIGFPLTIWINKHLYDKKFENVEKLLDDLNRFEKEE
jgi:hypothetical protein